MIPNSSNWFSNYFFGDNLPRNPPRANKCSLLISMQFPKFLLDYVFFLFSISTVEVAKKNATVNQDTYSQFV